MAEFSYTDYFENEVLRKRPYLKKDWCEFVIENPIHSEPQEQNRYRFWAPITEPDGRCLRVITLEDKVTIHNAFSDQGFTPWNSTTILKQILFISIYPADPAPTAARYLKVSYSIYDIEGKLVGIAIDNANHKVELQKLVLSKLSDKVETAAV